MSKIMHMNEMYYIYETPIGKVTIINEEGAITAIRLGEWRTEDGICRQTEAADKAALQLEEYFTKKRRTFDLVLRPTGTAFQKQVWNALLRIPYGETRSYKQIAEEIGNPKACRAVGMANNRNPILIVIPCHRVIGADGSLVGYGGGLPVKRQLLDMERNERR